MRIVRFSDGSSPKYGFIKDDSTRIFGLRGDPLFNQIELSGEVFELDEVRLLSPVIPRSKVVGVGRNYAAHVAEMGAEVPSEPVFFIKPNTSVIGPDDPIVLPRWSNHVEPEGELAVIIKTVAKDLNPEDVDDVVFGYTIGNDVSARDKQKLDGQWTRAKGFDSACPLGPWVVVDPELDVDNLRITTTVNGEVRQDDSTSSMIVGVRDLIVAASQVFTLLPGDVILTGTPAGVAPIQAGDRVSIEIEGIGTLTNPVLRR
ncbi:fumarylacetoacetate hydrolase family protein [Actinomyces minihominis]|uniref:fumarylacetoacetate hydrolase family protein n=1 Tax=Actinomyces minihominis TaxID=2002838 RepID=UPI000C06D219|nr:fumarylacetoacetate hydrolase family protein [Actinomyces minihominis]